VALSHPDAFEPEGQGRLPLLRVMGGEDERRHSSLAQAVTVSPGSQSWNRLNAFSPEKTSIHAMRRALKPARPPAIGCRSPLSSS
jgi:hypothetical protein